MVSASNAYDTYLRNAVFTASPEELTLMLYNGLIRFIMQGQKAIEEKDIQKAHNSIIRAEDIILEFKSTLDMQYEISKYLNALYDYMYDRLVEANLTKDTAILAEVLKIAKVLRDAWAEAMKIAKKESKVVQAAK